MTTPTTEQLAPIEALYEAGLYLQAYRQSTRLGALAGWRGTSARLLAGRLAVHLGAQRLGRVLHASAYRHDRDDLAAHFFYAYTVLNLRGPVPAWQVLSQREDDVEGPAEIRADWLALHGAVLSRLRDFQEAERWLGRAQAVAPDNPWVEVERSVSLELQDRYQESLEAARRSLELRPWFRPGIQATAHALVLLEREDAAVELLEQAAARTESWLIAAQLGSSYMERERYSQAQALYERIGELTPLADLEFTEWLTGCRAEAAYRCGDRERAAELYRAVAGPFHQRLAGRLERPGPDAKVLLPVGFVRQHHVTCSPATLAAVSRYWKMAADHLEVAGAICYDGTPCHSERRWADDNGWLAREFSFSWDTAVALLDRGVPFILTTTQAASGHAQAVIGYDEQRGSLVVRDPYVPSRIEFDAEALATYDRANGPRCMVLVPRAEADRLVGLELPDAAAFDLHYQVELALERHDRAGALAACAALEASAPGHRLGLFARRSLAAYDADGPALLDCVDRLLEQFDDDPRLRWSRLETLKMLDRTREVLGMLAGITAEERCDPSFLVEYARELAVDARELARARRMVRRALLGRPTEGNFLHTLAGLTWDQRAFADAVTLYRFAACADDRNEQFASSYFLAARHQGQTEVALGYLRDRCERFGARSGFPARTLHWALTVLDRTDEGLAVLRAALTQRPDDGALELFAADAHARSGDFARAETLLSACRERVRPHAWLRAAARIASYRGAAHEALAYWEQLLAMEPLAIDGVGAVAQLKVSIAGRTAAIEHLAGVCAQFPHNAALHRLFIQWLREDDPGQLEEAIRRLLAVSPDDAWGRRELGYLLVRLDRAEAAAAEAELAVALEPNHASGHILRAHVAELGHDRAASLAHLRAAIELNVDSGYAIRMLGELSSDREARRAAVEFVLAELTRQSTTGDGLVAYADLARTVLPPEALIANLRAVLAARPDLSAAWSVVILQLASDGELDQARALAEQACERFPLQPQVWLDRARIAQLRGDPVAERSALEHALEIAPGQADAALPLAACQERAGDLDGARSTLERVLSSSPLDLAVHSRLASVLWLLDRRAQALQRLEQLLGLDPSDHDGWELYAHWQVANDTQAQAVEFALALTRERPGHPSCWVGLGYCLSRPEQLDERLAALDRALAIEPRLTVAHDLKMTTLAEADRFDQARAALPAVYGDHVPSELRGRAAWVLARQGDLEAACKEMRGIVEAAPDYWWGALRLAEWTRAAQDLPAYQECAERLVRIAPRDPVGHTHLAEALDSQGQRAAAIAALERAADLDPSHFYAVMRLFDLVFEGGKLDAADAALARLVQHHPEEGWVMSAQVRLLAKRRQRKPAFERLRRLATLPNLDGRCLDEAIEALVAAGWKRTVRATCRSLLKRPSCQPAVARRAARDLSHGPRGGLLRRLEGRDALWRAAAVVHLERLAESGARWRFRWWFRNQAERLGRSIVTWGSVGYGLVTLGDMARARQWLGDWRGRDGVEPWMLLNLTLALWAARRWDELAELAVAVDAMPPDHAAPALRVWRAALQFITGRPEPAAGATLEELLGELDRDRRTPGDRFAVRVVEALDKGRAGDWKGVDRHLSAARAACPRYRLSPELKALMGAALATLAAARGGLGGRLWALGQRLRG